MRSKRVISVIIFISVLVILGISIIMLISEGYTYLCEDDFSFETGVAKGGYTLAGAIENAIGYCLEMQGTYFTVFLYFFLGPYGRWGIQGFHAVMIIMTMLFICSLLYLVWELVRRTVLFWSIGALTLISVFLMRGGQDNQELFFWYTGAINYTLVLTLSFIASGISIRLFREDNAKRIRCIILSVLASAAGFLASLGCLEITASNCAFLLAIILFGNKGSFRKNGIYRLSPFVFAMAGAVLNVTCPGNFTRADTWTSDGHATLIDAVRDTFRCHYAESMLILKSPLFILVLCLCLVLGVIFGVKIRHDGMNIPYLLLAAAGVYLTQYFTMFPVIYGYHSADLITSRTKSTYEIVARLLFMLFVLCLAQWISGLSPVISKGCAAAAAVGGAVACVVFAGAFMNDIRDGSVYRIASDGISGDMQRNYDMRMEVIRSMEEAPPGTDLVIEASLDDISSNFYGMGIGEDPGYIVNVSAATLFDLKSVTVFYR